MDKFPLVIIGAPTATGKSSLAINLALEFGGEIINADSLQVYRYLDIGTAKPTPEQRKLVHHHLLDVVAPDEEFNAAIYSEQARRIIADLARMHRPVFVVGGTGLYIRALLRGIIETPQVDENIRNHYRALREAKGKEYLHNLLRQRDAAAAARLNPNDSVRVIRALEVLEQSGESITAIQKRHSFHESPYLTCKIGLRVERAELKRRIGLRTEKMMADGLLQEVKTILKKGYDVNLKPLQSLGYKQAIEYGQGRYPLEEAIRLINRATWHYAKRQMTWFGADTEIDWYHPDSVKEIHKKVREFLLNNPC